MEYKILNPLNGTRIPVVGFGTDYIREDCIVNAVKKAIKVGYRSIDTAFCQWNEVGLGKAVKESIDEGGGVVKRQDLFITTKKHTWSWKEQGYKQTLKEFDLSMKNLGLEYLDLYMLHCPIQQNWCDNWENLNIDLWAALEKLYKDGRVRAIGVSNYSSKYLKLLMENCEIKPMVNQIQLHPCYQQTEIVNYCKQNNIILQAWAPLMHGKCGDYEVINKLAEKYNKTPAQICIRWSLQNNFIPLVKSVNEERMKSNLEVFDFKISEEDMNRIDGMNGKGYRHEYVIDGSPKYFKKYPKTNIKLFGIIPLLTVKSKTERKDIYYLFGFIPILKLKRSK
jgi:diketogulonate reductase-like aldo/keto reductase